MNVYTLVLYLPFILSVVCPLRTTKFTLVATLNFTGTFSLQSKLESFKIQYIFRFEIFFHHLSKFIIRTKNFCSLWRGLNYLQQSD